MRRQSIVGIGLASMIVASWLALHVYAVFLFRPTLAEAPVAALLVALACWLNVGLFIVAHDAMHGSLVPGSRSVNLWFGRLALGLYAGFRFDRLKALHLAHHQSPGSASDPDFDAHAPTRFWPWYATFMTRYFGLSEFLILGVPVAIYLFVGVRLSNLLLFWALPAALSSAQLFYFGTFLPHRHERLAFKDAHNARTTEFNWAVSLLTCFHFGYHHEHHLKPNVPWWGLPSERKRQALARSGRQPATPRPPL